MNKTEFKKSIDVFISHSSKDHKLADALCHYLEERDIRCWIAPRDINKKVGNDYGESIIEGIKVSKIMVVIFNKNANESSFVKNEVERAFHYKLIIMPFKTDTTIPSGKLELFLSSIHWLDAIETNAENYFDELYKSCSTILNKTYLSLSKKEEFAEQKNENISNSIVKENKFKSPTSFISKYKFKLLKAISLIILIATIAFTINFIYNSKNAIIKKNSDNVQNLTKEDSSSNNKKDTPTNVLVPKVVQPLKIVDTVKSPVTTNTQKVQFDTAWKTKYESTLANCLYYEKIALEDLKLLESDYVAYKNKRAEGKIESLQSIKNRFVYALYETKFPANAIDEKKFLESKIKFWDNKYNKDDYLLRKSFEFLDNAFNRLYLGDSETRNEDFKFIELNFIKGYNLYKKIQVKNYIISLLDERIKFFVSGLYHNGLVKIRNTINKL
jgi:hypothetical protein